jgi:von Willebrand factor type A domain
MRVFRLIALAIISIGIVFLLQACPPPPPPPDPCLEAIKKFPLEPTASLSPTPSSNYKPTAIIILDASGSMNEPVSKTSQTTKIEDAKSVIDGIVRNPLSESLSLGLVALGHLTDTCQNNVEMLLDPSLGKPNNLILNSLNIKPRGSTPLAEAIRVTGNQLLKIKKQQDQRFTIVLVSDGSETCKGDPLAEVENLKKQGLQFVFHAIGYGTDAKVNQELENLTKAGNGKLFNPNSSKQLQDDLKKSVYGFGQFSLMKSESINIRGWKLYEGNEPILQVTRTSKSPDLLWQPQTMQTGKYDLCVSFEDKDSKKETAYAKKVQIEANKLTVVDSSKP